MTIPVQSGKINISSWAFGLGSFCFLVIFVLRFVFYLAVFVAALQIVLLFLRFGACYAGINGFG